MWSALSPLIAVLLWLSLAPAARAVSPLRLTWDELNQLIGKKVSIALYDGGAVSGKVREVQPDALVLEVSKTSNPVACPKGLMRVPRSTLHVLDLHGKGYKYRVMGTAIGAVAGAAGGIGIGIAVQGGLFNDNGHATAAGVAGIAVMSGVTAAGYVLGNAADRRTRTVQIVH